MKTNPGSLERHDLPDGIPPVATMLSFSMPSMCQLPPLYRGCSGVRWLS